jgi:hypothetical protein
MRNVAVRLLLGAVFVALLLGAGRARAENPGLVADVGLGDSYAISLEDASGATVKHLDPGTYTLVVRDHSSLHNFHLDGPGVDVSTDVESVETRTFTVSFVDGTYFFQCDAHVGQMHGTFTVGAVSAPPAPSKLTGSIGPGTTFTLRRPSGLAAGTAVVTVADRLATDGFRLAGPGVSKATGVTFRGTVSWKVTLQAGRYSFGSLKRPRFRRVFTVSAG